MAMRRSVPAIVLFGLLIGLTGLAAAQAPARTAHGTGRMAALRVGPTAATGPAVAGVRIVFLRTAGSGRVPPPVTTRADGSFRQSGFAAGSTYQARQSKTGLSFDPPVQQLGAGSLDFV